MKLSKRFNQEQVAGGAAALLGTLLVAMGLVAGPSVTPFRAPPELERTYQGPPARAAEFLGDSFDTYWKPGRNPFEAAATSSLPIPELRAPEPPAEEPVLPPLRPGPTSEALNRLKSPLRYRALRGLPPAWTDADLPAAADLDALKALPETETSMPADRRHDKEHEDDIVHLANGQTRVGRIKAIDMAGVVHMQIKGAAMSLAIPPSDIAQDPEDRTQKWIERSESYEKRYQGRASRLRPGDLEKHLKLARWARALGMVPEARQEFRLAVAAAKARGDFRGDGAAAVRELGDLLLQITDLDGALGLFVEAASLAQGDKPEYLARAGDCLRALGVLEGAIECYRNSINESPRYVRGRLSLARSLLEAGRDDEALSTLAQLSNFVLPKETPAAELAEAALLQGLARLRAGDLRAARACFADALKADPGLAEAINANGVAAALEGRGKEASAAFVQALKANPWLGDAWTNLGLMYVAAGKAPEAEALFNAAQTRDPSSAEPALGLAAAAVLRGVPAEALAAAERALSIDPRHPAALTLAAALMIGSGGDTAKALAFAEEALRADFHHLPAYTAAASLHLARARALEVEAAALADRDPAKADEAWQAARTYCIQAETLLNAARPFDPDRSPIHVAHACALAMQGRAQEARDALTVAQSKRSGSDPLISYAFGWVEQRHGAGEPRTRMEAARGYFTAGSRIPGGSPWAAECGSAVQRINDWLETVIRLDDRFEGREGERVGAGWLDFDGRSGIRITVGKGECLFSGRQERDRDLTTLERVTPRLGFLSFEATLRPTATARCEYGIAIMTSRLGPGENDPWQAFWVGFDSAGRLRHLVQGTQEAKGGQLEIGSTEVKAVIPDPKEIRLKIERHEPKPGQRTFSLGVWDPAKGQYETVAKDIPFLDGTGAYRVAVWARAPKGAEYSFSVDNIRILEKAK